MASVSQKADVRYPLDGSQSLRQALSKVLSNPLGSDIKTWCTGPPQDQLWPVFCVLLLLIS